MNTYVHYFNHSTPTSYFILTWSWGKATIRAAAMPNVWSHHPDPHTAGQHVHPDETLSHDLEKTHINFEHSYFCFSLQAHTTQRIQINLKHSYFFTFLQTQNNTFRMHISQHLRAMNFAAPLWNEVINVSKTLRCNIDTSFYIELEKKKKYGKERN